MDRRAIGRRRDGKGGSGAYGGGIFEGAFYCHGTGGQCVPRQMSRIVHGDYRASLDVRDRAGGGIAHQIEHLGFALKTATEHRERHAMELQVLAT